MLKFKTESSFVLPSTYLIIFTIIKIRRRCERLLEFYSCMYSSTQEFYLQKGNEFIRKHIKKHSRVNNLGNSSQAPTHTERRCSFVRRSNFWETVSSQCCNIAFNILPVHLALPLSTDSTTFTPKQVKSP